MSYHVIDRGVWPLWVLLLLLYAIGMAWLILDEAPSRLIAVLAPASGADAIQPPRPDSDQRLPSPATGASPPEGLERVTGAVDRLRAKLETAPDLSLKMDEGIARLRAYLGGLLGQLDEKLVTTLEASRQAAPAKTDPDLALRMDEGLARFRAEFGGILRRLDEKLTAAIVVSRQAPPSEAGPDLAVKLDDGLARLRTELAGILGPLDEKLAAAVAASRQAAPSETGPDLALKLDEGLGRLRAELGDVVGQLDQKLAGAASQQTASQQMAVSELGTGVAALTNAVLELERTVRALSDDQAGLRRDVLDIGAQLREMPVPAPADTAPGRAVTVFEPRTIADELQDLLDEVAEADSVPTLTPRFARSGDRS